MKIPLLKKWNICHLKASTTTAKTVEHTEEEVEGEEGFEENQEQEEAPVVTTEASKKIKGGVRPFR